MEALRELARSVIDNPDKISSLTPEQVIALRRDFMNPANAVIGGKKCYACVSFTNWKDLYLRRLHTLTMSAFLYRKAYEIKDKDSSAITAFLDTCFEFNPDVHLRTSVDMAGVESAVNVMRFERDGSTIASTSTGASTGTGASTSDDAVVLAEARELLRAATSLYNRATELGDADAQGLVMKSKEKVIEVINKLSSTVDPAIVSETKLSLVPDNWFFDYDRYFTNHFDYLNMITESMYAERRDIDCGLTLYGVFDNEEAAHAFITQHADEFKAPVFTIESGGLTVLGPFKENKDRIEFYNKNSEILRRMIDQQEADHKIGKELMEKRVRVEKEKNVALAGPDDPALSAYSKAMNAAQSLGAKGSMTQEEQVKYADSLALAAEEFKVPANAVQVDMFSTEGDVLKKTSWYTEADDKK